LDWRIEVNRIKAILILLIEMSAIGKAETRRPVLDGSFHSFIGHEISLLFLYCASTALWFAQRV
jgi:hypothetical protein